MNGAQFTHWFLVATFAVAGAVCLLRPALVSDIRRYFTDMSIDWDFQERLLAAAEERQRLEGLSPWLGLVTGALLLVWAAVGAFTKVPLTILYAILCVAMATLVAVGYVRLRRLPSKRVATLEVRTPLTVAPVYWYGASCVAAFLPLIDVAVPSVRITAVVVSACAFALLVLAWQWASAPELLAGTDPGPEKFVDDRLRLVRTGNALVFTTVIVMLYFTQTMDLGKSHLFVGIVAIVLYFVLLVICLRRQRASPTSQETARW